MTGKRILLRRARRAAALTIGAASAAGALSAGAIGSPHSTTVFLASNHGHDMPQSVCAARGGCGPEVSAPVVLRAGTTYSIVVTGTVSVWGIWSPRTCGSPEPRPEFPTGHETPTGDDAVFRFAYHSVGNDCRLLPQRFGLFQINLGGGWFSPTALGNPSAPSGDHGRVQHPYEFRVVGLGHKPMFRFNDFHPSDNNGAFKIVIRAA